MDSNQVLELNIIINDYDDKHKQTNINEKTKRPHDKIVNSHQQIILDENTQVSFDLAPIKKTKTEKSYNYIELYTDGKKYISFFINKLFI